VDGFAVHAFNVCRHGRDTTGVAYRRVDSCGVLAASLLLVELSTLRV